MLLLNTSNSFFEPTSSQNDFGRAYYYGIPIGAATSTTTIPAGTATTAAVIPITVPRIGGVITEPNGDQIAWMGGPERVRLAGHKSVDCLRPRGYKYQKQVQDTCEKGLPEVQRIEEQYLEEQLSGYQHHAERTVREPHDC